MASNSLAKFILEIKICLGTLRILPKMTMFIKKYIFRQITKEIVHYYVPYFLNVCAM